MYSKPTKYFLPSVLALTLSSTALAHSEGDVFARAGLGMVIPNESSNDPNNVGELELTDETNLAGTVTYMFSDNIGFEVLLGLPFTHEISTSALGTAAEVSHLPLSVAAQYYFGEADSKIRPYVGGGFNYTTFLDEEGKGVLANATVTVDNSFGLAFQAGVDFEVTEQIFINLSAWYLDIETTVHATGINDIDATVDPWAIMLAAGYTF